MLIERVREGDPSARNDLLARYLPMLRRWSHGRLPQAARDIADTDDLVQVALMRALNKIEGFVSQREGAFLGYLRTAVLNSVRDELRRMARRPGRGLLDEGLPTPGPLTLRRPIPWWRRVLASAPARP